MDRAGEKARMTWRCDCDLDLRRDGSDEPWVRGFGVRVM